jgi:hypothetical protein
MPHAPCPSLQPSSNKLPARSLCLSSGAAASLCTVPYATRASGIQQPGLTYMECFSSATNSSALRLFEVV